MWTIKRVSIERSYRESAQVVYAAFTLWLFLILFAGIAVYHLWTKLIASSWVHWILLPGTVVSEMAYIFACMITGGEIRRARLVPEKQAQRGAAAEPSAETTSGIRYVGPVIAALVAIVACGAAILAVHALLGGPVIKTFLFGRANLLPAAGLPKSLPTDWNGLWAQVSAHVGLLKRMCETWAEVDWLNWRVPLFVYLSLCLAIRLTPVRRATRPTLAAVVAIAAVIALIGLLWPRLSGLMDKIWPLLTYVWAMLLFLLVMTLLLQGLVALARVLAGKSST